MAILHVATLTPSKLELITSWLEAQPWAGVGDVSVVGTYRFDDPDGEVGVEAFVVRRGDLLLHVPLTYRAAPLEGGSLIGNTEHSVLGTRWVYDATSDPVAVGCFVRALRGEQVQAEMEIWDADRLVERRSSKLRVSVETGPGTSAGSGESVSVEYDCSKARLARVLDGQISGTQMLVVSWTAGTAAVAVLAPS